jgi:hypothetical protein
MLELPDQSWLFGQLDGRLIPEARPIVSNWTVAPFRGELFRYTFRAKSPRASTAGWPALPSPTGLG